MMQQIICLKMVMKKLLVTNMYVCPLLPADFFAMWLYWSFGLLYVNEQKIKKKATKRFPTDHLLCHNETLLLMKTRYINP
jgi:hypothetical protein